MRKKILLACTGHFLALLVYSQQASPSVMSSDGGIDEAAGVRLEWTLGEPYVESLTDHMRLYTQGFHQPLLVFKNSIDVAYENQSGYRVQVAPNPVLSFLTVTIRASRGERFFCSILDMTGRKLIVQPVAGKEISTRVDMSSLTPGIYLLETRNETGSVIYTNKIIRVR